MSIISATFSPYPPPISHVYTLWIYSLKTSKIGNPPLLPLWSSSGHPPATLSEDFSLLRTRFISATFPLADPSGRIFLDLLHAQDDGDLPLCSLSELHRLTCLFGSTSPPALSSVFLKSFAFPNLHLDVEVDGWTEDALFSLQERSRFALAPLSFHNVSLDLATISRFLTANPTIENFGLQWFTDQRIIDVLTYEPSQSSVLLPRLAVRFILSNNRLSASGDDLVKMLRSRWDLDLCPPDSPVFAQLEQVDITLSCGPLTLAAEAAIQHMDSAGLLNDHIPRL
ncbi:hypothetical protein DFH07DRAFT_963255 [Mycena maculata]|uniref:Uncharacterized protein n=1 Tax=Mycena maculata TaxID=230809 RepID=A0AAD7IL03_9AGAR|nr:hypothetical protein DFH07DRAFT_963255 [Mycena maculata]